MLLILIHNDSTGTDSSANYNYEVRINRHTIERGRVEGHNRKDGWRKLVQEIVDRQQIGKSDENRKE